MEPDYTLIRVISILISLYILRLIYTHKLRIGYSWLLFILGMGFVVLSISPNVISVIKYITGSVCFITNIIFYLIISLFLIIVHCTLMISSLTSHVKELGQEISLLSSELDEEKLKREAGVAHLISSATVSPLVTDHLKNVNNHMHSNHNNFHPKTSALATADPDNKSKHKKSTSNTALKSNPEGIHTVPSK